MASMAETHIRLPLGSGAVIAAICSLATCYSGMLGQIVFGIEGLIFNPHFQAILMWGLALVAVYFLSRNRQNHGGNLPILLGAAAAITLIATLYLGYDQQIEAMSYVLLVIATFLNQNLLLTSMHRTVRDQSAEIAGLNHQLAQRLERSENQVYRLERLKHFLSPRIAELVVADDKHQLLQSHRSYIACLFCDIRNLSSLAEQAEPEEVIALLRQFHDRAGGIVADHGGTIGFRAGDGLMVFFNDPIPCDAPVLDAVRTGLDIRAAFAEIQTPWVRRGYEIGLGVGVASGFATLGLVGQRAHADYSAIGPVVNAASRICDAARDGQILLTRRAFLDVETDVLAEPLASIEVKGFSKPVDIVAIHGTVDPRHRSSGHTDDSA
jgi:class 3 adenylate cyclase